MIVAHLLLAFGIALLGWAWWVNARALPGDNRAGYDVILIGLSLSLIGIVMFVIIRFFRLIGIL